MNLDDLGDARQQFVGGAVRKVVLNPEKGARNQSAHSRKEGDAHAAAHFRQ